MGDETDDPGCEECGECNSINIEAWEVLDRILCEDCGPGALEEAAEEEAV